jgi:hypothetical protein
MKVVRFCGIFVRVLTVCVGRSKGWNVCMWESMWLGRTRCFASQRLFIASCALRLLHIHPIALSLTLPTLPTFTHMFIYMHIDTNKLTHSHSHAHTYTYTTTTTQSRSSSVSRFWKAHESHTWSKAELPVKDLAAITNASKPIFPCDGKVFVHLLVAQWRS